MLVNWVFGVEFCAVTTPEFASIDAAAVLLDWNVQGTVGKSGRLNWSISFTA